MLHDFYLDFFVFLSQKYFYKIFNIKKKFFYSAKNFIKNKKFSPYFLKKINIF